MVPWSAWKPAEAWLGLRQVPGAHPAERSRQRPALVPGQADAAGETWARRSSRYRRACSLPGTLEAGRSAQAASVHAEAGSRRGLRFLPSRAGKNGLSDEPGCAQRRHGGCGMTRGLQAWLCPFGRRLDPKRAQAGQRKKPNRGDAVRRSRMFTSSPLGNPASPPMAGTVVFRPQLALGVAFQ